MYVLFVARGYPTEKYSMNGIFEYDQAKALTTHGIKVVYVALDLRSLRRWRTWGITKHNTDGFDVYTINLPLGGTTEEFLAKKGAWGLKKLYKRIIQDHGKPSLIHAHFAKPAYSAAVLKLEADIPLVITEHSSDINKKIIDQRLFKVAEYAYKHADEIIAVSPALRNKIKDDFNILPVFVPNIIDLNVFEYKEKVPDGKFHFISTGNLRKVKRMDLTIQAFHDAFKDKPDVTLTIFGEGEERVALEELIKSYDLQSRIHLKGLCPREEIACSLRQSDCFVLASQSETFGLSYLEALAMGIPVIATRSGGPEIFVNSNNGLMIDINSLDQLIKAMEYMYQHIDTFDRYTIAANVRSEFSTDKVSRQIVAVYENVLRQSQ